MELTCYFDFVCPFCYLGYHALKQAAGRHGFTVRYLPWELSPGSGKRPATPEQAERFKTRLKPLADRLGIPMILPPLRSVSSLALQGVYLAREEGVEAAYLEAVFHACHAEGRDIGWAEVLLDIWSGLGQHPSQLAAALADGRFQAPLEEDRRRGAALAFPTIPACYAGDRVLLDAFDPDALDRALRAWAAEM